MTSSMSLFGHFSHEPQGAEDGGNDWYSHVSTRQRRSSIKVELTGRGDYIQPSIQSIKSRHTLPPLASNDLLGGVSCQALFLQTRQTVATPPGLINLPSLRGRCSLRPHDRDCESPSSRLK
jgi:hypothetical protein